jgi:hypothetical protein
MPDRERHDESTVILDRAQREVIQNPMAFKMDAGSSPA